MTTVGAATVAPKSTSINSATTGSTASKTGSSKTPGKDDFMKLLLAQLQHQDPLKPMDDQAFIAQVAQFNALEAMQNVDKTLTAVLHSQQLSEATGMIGKTINATDKDAKPVTGVVTGVSVESGFAKLHLGEKVVAIDKVLAVASDAASLPPVAPPPAAVPGTTTKPKWVNARA